MNRSRWAPQPETALEKTLSPAETPSSSVPTLPAPSDTTPTTATGPDATHAEEKMAEPASTASGLSAVAATFSPGPAWDEAHDSVPPPDASSIDIFAQTGGGEDDLFDDVTPEDESMRVRSDDDLFSEDFIPAPATQHIAEVAPQLESATVDSSVRGLDGPQNTNEGASTRGQSTARRRGPRTRGGRQLRGDRQPSTQGSRDADLDSSATATSVAANSPDPPPDAPTGPKKETVPSVRGDRQATGGLKRPKLTESELAEKMAQIQIKNASLTAAHERAEADAASFAERENLAKIEAAQREKVERKDRQQLLSEREKNRMRKLKAMDAREWDAEKNEGDFARGGKFDSKGGFAGDKADYTDGREYLYQESRSGSAGGRGRGGRGERARGGRGGHRDVAKVPSHGEDEFPALPAAKVSAVAADMKTPMTSWADQVENT